MSFDGVSKVAINRDGDLELRTAAGVMLSHKPILYQTIAGQRKPVSGDFVLLAKNEAGFRVGSYDTSKTLVIDPVMVPVNAGIGGLLNDEGFAIGVNGTQVVLTGRTQSVTNTAPPNNTPDKPGSGFPVLAALAGQGQHSAGGSWDVFVTKFTIDPVTTKALMVYSTYLGTSSDEAGEGVGVDSAGNAYIAGYTDSAALLPVSPAPAAAFSGVYDAFIAELNPAGSAIIASTYVGGPGTTQAFGLAIDPKTGNIVIGGVTNGLAVAPGGVQKIFGGGTTDGFVASFAPSTLALVASTYIGGSNYEQVNAVAAGPDGAVYASGLTASGNAGGGGTFPTKAAIGVGAGAPGQQNAVVAKYTSTSLGSETYASIFGAGGEDANGVAGDANGVAYVVGATKRPNFSSATQGVCGIGAIGGTLPAGATYGTAIQWTAACPTDPGQTQGYLLSLTTAGAINYLDLGPVTTHDAGNTAGCNLNLTKNGGALFLPGSACSGFVGSWNAVATDTDQQAHV